MTEAGLLAIVTWATVLVTVACIVVAAIMIASLLAEVRARRRRYHGDVFTYNRFWRKRK